MRVFGVGIIMLILIVGCLGGGPNPIVVQHDSKESISILKGNVYDVTALIRNEGESGNVTVTAELIATDTGVVRDQASDTFYMESGASKNIKLTLDGESGYDYSYTISAKAAE